MIIDGNSKTNDIRSFLMIGQSNMAGRGNIGEVEPIINPDCYMLRMGRWQQMSEPVNPDRSIFSGDFRSGVCLASSFADELSRRFGEKIGLIPCADGGTRIDQWMPGELLYDHAVYMARLAMRTSSFSGILWHQGESDCNSDEDVDAYKSKLLTFFNSLRRDLGVGNIPIVIGELSESADEKWEMGDRPAKLNKILHAIKNELPNCAVVSASSLELKKDGLHFDSASLRIFGKCYFEEYSKLVNAVSFRIYDRLPDESRRIRENVFVVEQGFCEEFDTVDNFAVHILAYDHMGNAIGTCRIFTEKDPFVLFLGRLAVSADCRGNGLGSLLLAEAEKYAMSNGMREIRLHSQYRAKAFYEKNGYTAFGEIDYEEDCPHIWMIKNIGGK